MPKKSLEIHLPWRYEQGRGIERLEEIAKDEDRSANELVVQALLNPAMEPVIADSQISRILGQHVQPEQVGVKRPRPVEIEHTHGQMTRSGLTPPSPSAANGSLG